MDSFESDKYPVTQKLWHAIMGQLPAGVQPNCPDCPITHVNWENADGSPAEVQEFLRRLNERDAASGCTYDLPTDKQLWYLIRADVTGHNIDRFSAGVTYENVNQHITSISNSNDQIQPVGQKTPNGFGIELGNVWKMSKDLYDPAHPSSGRTVRGSSWSNIVDFAESDYRCNAGADWSYNFVGFALVRICN